MIAKIVFYIEKNCSFFQQKFRTDFLWFNPLQKHQKFPPVQNVILCIANKQSPLQPLVPNRKTISIPEEHFHVVAVSIEEDEERAGKQLSGEELFYSGA